MIRAAVYGRLGADPVQHQTRNGDEMATASLALDVHRHGEPEGVEWFVVISFGKAADELARHAKGDFLAIMGTLTRSRFVGRDGIERSAWSVPVESLISARTVRPGGRRRNAGDHRAAQPTNGGSRAPLTNDGVSDLWI